MLIVKFVVFIFLAVFATSFLGAITGFCGQVVKIVLDKIKRSYHNSSDISGTISIAVSSFLLALYTAYLATVFGSESDSSIYYFVGGLIFIEQCSLVLSRTRKMMKENIMGDFLYESKIRIEKNICFAAFIGYISLCFLSEETFKSFILGSNLSRLFEWIYDIPILGVGLAIISIFYIARSTLGLYFLVALTWGEFAEKRKASKETPEQTAARHKMQAEEVRKIFSPPGK